MASPRQPPAVVVATPKSQLRQETASPVHSSTAKTVAFVNPTSWVNALRAERAKEPRQSKLDTGLSSALPAPVNRELGLQRAGYELSDRDAKELQEAMSMLKKALGEDPMFEPSPEQEDKVQASESEFPRQASEQVSETLAVTFADGASDTSERRSSPALFSETLNWWRDWDRKGYGQKGHPAWHEELNSLPPLPRSGPSRTPRNATSGSDGDAGLPSHSPRQRSAQPRTWMTEMKVQRQLLTQKKEGVPRSAAEIDAEVLLRSKNRLQRMIRAGQTAMVRQEMRASLHVKTNIFTAVAAGEVQDGDPKGHSPRKDAKRNKIKHHHQNSDARIALRKMTQQRNELGKARRLLADVLEAPIRREADSSNVSDAPRSTILAVANWLDGD
eukprot:TRINITY_DN76942_c0_g1_i1.p1 TRINITY_DN76942_c0_g1~~TRINITY_DN76942_c0_g1_i1.p1  ORF type:complete len:387 (-),score=82.84 TRINITY_DN76942_c0_g1_i1:109-1269(-)